MKHESVRTEVSVLVSLPDAGSNDGRIMKHESVRTEVSVLASLFDAGSNNGSDDKSTKKEEKKNPSTAQVLPL